MSEASKAYRAAAKQKIARLLGENKGPIDASGYKVPGEMDTERKTGEKPKNPRMFKRGGKVEGAEATHHAGKKPRAKRDMGGAMPQPSPTAAGSGTAGPMMNLPAAAQAQIANAARTPNPQGMLASRPVQSWMARAGGIKKGGRVKKAEGGEAHSDAKEDRKLIDKMVKPEARTGKKEGGKAHKASGGGMNDYDDMPPMKPSPNMPSTAYRRDPAGQVIEPKGYSIYNRITGSKVGSAGDMRRARAAVDRHDNKYGRAAHAVVPEYAKGGEVVGNSEVTGTRPTGGRLARKDGGKTSGKGKMNVNIIIAQKPDSALGSGAPPMSPGAAPHPIPPPVIPPASMGGAPGGMPGGMTGGMPSGMPAGMPPMRAAGGRLIPNMDAGAGGGEGRLEKLKEYGNKFAKEKNKGD